MTVNLTGVSDAQLITVTLSGVTDSFAQVLPDTAVSMRLLAGDASGNGSVSATDVSLTKTQSGAPVTNANFREDVVVTGSINGTDISLVKNHVSGWACRNRLDEAAFVALRHDVFCGGRLVRPRHVVV